MVKLGEGKIKTILATEDLSKCKNLKVRAWYNEIKKLEEERERIYSHYTYPLTAEMQRLKRCIIAYKQRGKF